LEEALDLSDRILNDDDEVHTHGTDCDVTIDYGGGLCLFAMYVLHHF